MTPARCRSAGFDSVREAEGMKLLTGRIVVSLLVVGHVATEGSASLDEALFEQLGGREPMIPQPLKASFLPG